jgi:hypothetical protein
VPLGSGGAPGLITSAPVGPIDGETFTFSGAGTGEYVGTTTVSESPFDSGGNVSNWYLEAQPGGTVTVTFATPQTAFDLLWGSVDNGNNGVNNTLAVTIDGFTYTGTQLDALIGVNGGNDYAEFGGFATPFTTVTFSDLGTGPAFEFVPGVPVSETGTLGMLGLGLIGLIALGGFRRRSLVGC